MLSSCNFLNKLKVQILIGVVLHVTLVSAFHGIRDGFQGHGAFPLWGGQCDVGSHEEYDEDDDDDDENDVADTNASYPSGC